MREEKGRVELIWSKENDVHSFDVHEAEVAKGSREAVEEDDDGGVDVRGEAESNDGTKRTTEGGEE